MIFDIFEFLTVAATGLLSGALLAEACVLVPYWRKMPISDFLSLHHTMATSLFRFYAPLTIAGTTIPILMAAISLVVGRSSYLWLLCGICAVSLLLFYFMFFKAANESFATGKDQDAANETLSTWAKLHMVRTAISITGFFSATLGIAIGN